MATNDRVGVKIEAHKTFKDRLKAAQGCCSALDMKVPLLIDGIDDAVCNKYSGYPDRLYLIDSAGKVAYKGGRGPFGFIPGELEQSIAMLLVDESRAKDKESEGKTTATDSAAKAADRGTDSP